MWFEDSDTPDPPPEQPKPSAAEDQSELSPAQALFKKCRWYAEDGDQKYCSNRDVLPYTGKGGFAPESWCPDCTLYKLRRTPKKRPRVEENDFP